MHEEIAKSRRLRSSERECVSNAKNRTTPCTIMSVREDCASPRSSERTENTADSESTGRCTMNEELGL